jgi:hypothetical protein
MMKHKLLTITSALASPRLSPLQHPRMPATYPPAPQAKCLARWPRLRPTHISRSMPIRHRRRQPTSFIVGTSRSRCMTTMGGSLATSTGKSANDNWPRLRIMARRGDCLLAQFLASVPERRRPAL